MISVPDAFFLIASVCMILSAAAFIKVCYIWLRDAESERKAQRYRDIIITKTYDEVLVANALLERICDELGIAYDDIECEHPGQRDEVECEDE